MSELNELDATNHLSEVWRFLSDVSWQSLVSPDPAANKRTVFLPKHWTSGKLSTLILAKVELKLIQYDKSFYNSTLYTYMYVDIPIYHYQYQYLSCFSTDDGKYFSSFYVPNPQGWDLKVTRFTNLCREVCYWSEHWTFYRPFHINLNKKLNKLNSQKCALKIKTTIDATHSQHHWCITNYVLPLLENYDTFNMLQHLGWLLCK